MRRWGTDLGPEILERTRAIDTVVLDKTGTLTQGAIEVTVTCPTTRAVIVSSERWSPPANTRSVERSPTLCPSGDISRTSGPSPAEGNRHGGRRTRGRRHPGGCVSSASKWPTPTRLFSRHGTQRYGRRSWSATPSGPPAPGRWNSCEIGLRTVLLTGDTRHAGAGR